MSLSPFHAYYKARDLSNHTSGKDRLLPAFASSSVEIYPYQVAAAMFALRSPYLKGMILCDEGSLGKTYEAMLIITQMWYEGTEKILLVVPTALLKQWQTIIEQYFSISFVTIDCSEVYDETKRACSNPFSQDGIVLTTYEFAFQKVEEIAQINWQLSVFEEAHHIKNAYRDGGKGVALRKATEGAYRLLLTATPMQNSILDLFGLIWWIDDTIFPDESAFYQRYFRKPERYQELAEQVNPFCFRTTRSQVSAYVSIPKRIPVTVEYTYTEQEQTLLEQLNQYIEQKQKAAYPQMDSYDLALMLTRTFSSSSQAIAKTLRGAVKRLEDLCAEEPGNTSLQQEWRQLLDMQKLADKITIGTKSQKLLAALKDGFARLKKLGAKQKALIFTENKTTLLALESFLNLHGYRGKVLTYSGDKTRNYSIIERFETDAQILIATDVAAEGFNLEFCSFVIHYDLPYNIMTIEQRINRCHRQGQKFDVIVLNFLNKNNFADVRMLELINKRILQFDGIFGLSEQVIGNFGVDFDKACRLARSKEEIDMEWNRVLAKHEQENMQLVKRTEQSLYTTFSDAVARKTVVSPQYIRSKIKQINDDLWQVTKYFFENRSGFTIDENTRTISCFGTPPKVFTGTRMGRNEYSMSEDYQPRSGRHTIAGSFAKNILREIFWRGVPDKGQIIVATLVESCTIGYYRIRVHERDALFGDKQYFVFAGRTGSGQILTDEECRERMELPVAQFYADDRWLGEPDGTQEKMQPDPIDALISPQKYLDRVAAEIDEEKQERIRRLRAQFTRRREQLERHPNALLKEIEEAQRRIEQAESRLERMQAQKQLASLQKARKQAEQNLFLDRLRLEQDLEEQISRVLEKDKWDVEIRREFLIVMEGVS